MDWVKILYWISVVVLWVLIGLNFWNIGRNFKLRKQLEIEIELCTKMTDACNEFLEAVREETYLKEEISDEGTN